MVFSIEGPEEFLKECRALIEKMNRNCIIVIVGGPGKGKSYLGLWLANALDSTFMRKLEERVCFKGKAFLRVLTYGSLEKGNAVMLDEAGVTMFNRNFFNFMNKAIVYVLQTFRHRNLYLILTVPSLAFIDAHVLRLLTYVVETVKINRKTNITTAKVYKVQHNPKEKKNYYKYLKRPYKTFESKKLFRFKFPKPGARLCNHYEKIADVYKRSLASQLYDETTFQDKLSKGTDVAEIGATVLNELNEYSRRDGSLNRARIELEHDIGRRYSSRVVEWVKKERKKRIMSKLDLLVDSPPISA